MRRACRWITGILGWGIGLCLCAGCAASAPVFPVTEHFRCRAAAEVDGTTFSGTLTRGGAGTMVWAMEEPPSVAGWTLSFDGKSLMAGLHGMTCELDARAMPSAAPAAAICAVLDAVPGMAERTTVEPTEDGGGKLVGTVKAGTFVLTSEAATGFLRSLSLPDSGLTVRFSAFEVGTFGMGTSRKPTAEASAEASAG